MHFDLIQSLGLAGDAARASDDRAGSGDRLAWVIDGATDLGPPGLMGTRGGAAWLALTADAAFAAAPGAPLSQVVAHVFDRVGEAFVAERTREPARGMAPLALVIDVDRRSERFLDGFESALRDQLRAAGESDQTRYRIIVRLDDDISGFGVRSDDSVTRERRTLRARWQLVDTANGSTLVDASAASDTGIDVVGSEYATIAAENTALERLSETVADQIVARVALYARRTAVAR